MDSVHNHYIKADENKTSSQQHIRRIETQLGATLTDQGITDQHFGFNLDQESTPHRRRPQQPVQNVLTPLTVERQLGAATQLLTIQRLQEQQPVHSPGQQRTTCRASNIQPTRQKLPVQNPTSSISRAATGSRTATPTDPVITDQQPGFNSGQQRNTQS